MKEPKSIQKADSSPFHKDFKDLKNQGIEALQKLSGELWTDYNTHDPGVTVLENLVFAITDLCYKMGFEVSDRIYITEVHATVEGDTFFPEWDKSDWQEVSRTHHDADERHAFAFDFVVYDKIKK
ncbi:MAG: dihydrofolate reductase [Bacteroidota bacterium]